MMHSDESKWPLSFQLALQVMGEVPIRGGTCSDHVEYVTRTFTSEISILALRLSTEQVVSVLAEEGRMSRIRLWLTPEAMKQTTRWQQSARHRVIGSIIDSAAVMIEAMSEGIPPQLIGPLFSAPCATAAE